MSDSITIRRAYEQDAEKIGLLWFALSKHHEAYHEYYKVAPQGKAALIAHVYDLLRRECICYVAELDGDICGFVTGYVVRRNPQLVVDRVGKVDNFFVKEGYRGKQVGSQLISALLSLFTQQEIHFVEISCDLQNPDALRLYQRLGFVEQKVMLIKEL